MLWPALQKNGVNKSIYSKIHEAYRNGKSLITLLSLQKRE